MTEQPGHEPLSPANPMHQPDRTGDVVEIPQVEGYEILGLLGEGRLTDADGALAVLYKLATCPQVTFAYPGLGYLVFQAVGNNDYFLLQGIFLFIIIGVLLANFIVDIVYVLVDPRTRVAMRGGTA